MAATSEITLTVTIEGDEGIPYDISPTTLAALATRGISDYLSARGATPDTIKSKVQSAFLVRKGPQEVSK